VNLASALLTNLHILGKVLIAISGVEARRKLNEPRRISGKSQAGKKQLPARDGDKKQHGLNLTPQLSTMFIQFLPHI
jgi:hypothetical protein